jgi:choline dehydrogenase-like flavoprotein
MGHVGGVIARVRFCTPPRDTIFGYERDVDGTRVRRRFSIERNAQLDRELPNAIAFLANPELADYRHQNGVLSFAHLTLRSPVGQLIAPAAQRVTVTGEKGTESATNLASLAPKRPHLANVARDWTSVARFAASFGARRFLARGRKIPGFFAAYSADNLYPLQYHGEHIPSRQSRVSLASDRDAVGMPKLHIDLRFSKRDVDGILRCHQIWDNHLRQSGRGYLEYMSSDPGSLVWNNMGGGTHQLGMTRMAAQAEDGVVGKSLAVHGMSNLFVASSSVFLTSGQANPTFMIVVFALRLSDHLRSNLGAL